MSGLTRDEIVKLTGYSADLVLRICTDAGVSGGALAAAFGVLAILVLLASLMHVTQVRRGRLQ